MDALDGDKLRAFPFRKRPRTRIYQFDRSRGVLGFPDKPQDALKGFDRATLKPSEVIWKRLRRIGKIWAMGLKPGDPHYRAYVGPPEDYDLDRSDDVQSSHHAWPAAASFIARCRLRFAPDRTLC